MLSEPVEHLSQRVQHLDSNGHTVTEIFLETGPLAACQHQLQQFLEPGRESALDVLLHHFDGGPGADRATTAIINDFTGDLINVASQVWARHELVLFSLPWLMLHRRRYLYEANMCCVDDGLGVPLRMIAPDDRRLLRQGAWPMLFQALRRHLELANMDTEALLALLKKRPTAQQAETMCGGDGLRWCPRAVA